MNVTDIKFKLRLAVELHCELTMYCILLCIHHYILHHYL